MQCSGLLCQVIPPSQVPFTIHSLTHSPFGVSSQTDVRGLGLWEETGAAGENAKRQRYS